MIDDVDKDKDYNPNKDPEADFVAEDQDIEDDETFKVEKHIHAINIIEAGDYLVAMRRYMEAFERIIHRGKCDVPREYKKTDTLHETDDRQAWCVLPDQGWRCGCGV